MLYVGHAPDMRGAAVEVKADMAFHIVIGHGILSVRPALYRCGNKARADVDDDRTL